MKRVTAKLGTMRKAREWIVMPTSDDRIIVQAEGAIGIFDWRTRAGRLTTRGGYFPHLAIARPFEFPQDFVTECLRVCPSLGGTTEIGGGVAIIQNTVEIIK